MKKLFLFLLMTVTVTAYTQKTDLTMVQSGKVKLGQTTAFEAAYKQHVAKFHKTDYKENIFQIISGPNTGVIFFTRGGQSFADLDKERADASAHTADLEKNFFPYMQETYGTYFYRFNDSLSFHPDVQAEKFVVNVYNIKSETNLGDYRRELARGIKIISKVKSNFFDHLSFQTYEQLWDGSNPVFVRIRALNEGFKVLEQNYYGPIFPPGGPSFRDEYVKEYGYDAWDARTKLFDNAFEKIETYIMKYRKDLSSQ